MARLQFKRIARPPLDQPVYEDEGAQEARRMQREGLRDVVWVAIGLALILVVGLIYEWNQGSDRRAARARAEAAARTMPAVPYTAYQPAPSRYPTVEEIQADQVVREARELAAANAAANASDPALNHDLAKPTAPAYSPVPPSPFGPQNGMPAAVAPTAVAPATPQPASPRPIGPQQ